MGPNGPGGLGGWAHSRPMGSKGGPKARPISGLGWVGLGYGLMGYAEV